MLAPRAFLALAVVALLGGCASPGGQPDAVSAASSSSAAPTAAAVDTIESVQPGPLIDLDCSDFAAVAGIGMLRGVTERDPRGVSFDLFEKVPVADIVRNAGGIACEFSDGGLWRLPDDSGRELNESWHGAAIFVVPNAAVAEATVFPVDECGDSTTSARYTVCSWHFTAGGAWIHIVVSTNDRRETIFAVRDLVTATVAAAVSTPGPIPRPEGTFDPPHECSALMDAAAVGVALGATDITADRAIEIESEADASYFTENTGCLWYVDSLPHALEVLVYPGGAWAASLSLPSLGASPVTLAGLGEGTAASHCTAVPQWGYAMCTVEVVVAGTWFRAIGTAETEADAATIAIAAAEAVLRHRE